MRKKTAQQKELSGTVEKSRIPGPVGGGGGGIQPATYLDANMLPFFDAILEHLKGNDATQKIDGQAVSLAALWLWMLHDSVERVKESGPVQVYPTGAMASHPNVQNMTNASKQLEKWFSELGMTPKAREALTTFQRKPDQDTDPLADLIKL